MLSQYLHYLDTPSLLAGKTHVLGISVIFFYHKQVVSQAQEHGKTVPPTSYLGYMYLTCTLPYLIYDQQQQFRHENGVNATSS